VTTDVLSTVATLLAAAASAAVESLTVGEQLTPGEVSTDSADLSLASAVLVPFTGSVNGELALLVDAEVATALQNSTIGSLDLAAALAPAISAIAVAIGPVTLGVAQPLDARLAQHRIAGHADSGTITLHGATAVRAAIAIGTDPSTEVVGTSPAAFDRLDLLRGVEMQASVELGRARMTINELLSLHNGAVIELDRAAGEAVDLFVNGRLIARGEVVVVDENYALRITQIVVDEASR
jgi:flagellar motor switch protein FliN/FliY